MRGGAWWRADGGRGGEEDRSHDAIERAPAVAEVLRGVGIAHPLSCDAVAMQSGAFFVSFSFFPSA